MARATGDVLIRVEMQQGAALLGAAAAVSAAGTTFQLQPLFEVPPAATAPGLGARAGGRTVWHLAKPKQITTASPWDVARDLARQTAATGAVVSHVEPDLVQDWPVPTPSIVGLGADSDNFEDQSDDGGKATRPHEFAWHLGDAFSQIGSARDDARANQTATIRIAHLDVGYGLDHAIFPRANFEPLLSKNCADDGRGDRDVSDEVKPGTMRNPGHGTGTLGILAGGRFKFDEEGYQFDDEIGAALDARIVGVRIGNSVVQIKTSAIARAIAYVAELCKNEETRVHVLSMSVGGVASTAWAEAVNLAYLAGVVMVTAAGNNFSAGFAGGVPTTSTVYPARFQRVLSACGVMADYKPYYKLERGTMQGNFGPKSKKSTSLAAFTPNTPWARRSDKNVVDMNGAGTSSATPQIAGTAALYLQKHGATLFDTAKYPQPWMRVEAVREALRSSARTDILKDQLQDYTAGIIQAKTALNTLPVAWQNLKQSEEAKASFAFFHALSGLGLQGDMPADPLLELEMAQLVQQWDDGPNPFDDLLAKAETQPGGLTAKDRQELKDKLRTHPRASRALRLALGAPGNPPPGGLPPGEGGAGGVGAPPAPPAAPMFTTPLRFEPDVPKYRELRGYALDPSFAVSLATRKVSETIYRVPWDPTLASGPRDTYLEVIDVDPASRLAYEPVDLQHPHLLATQGLAPSEGTPQFHQQMVYAVARMTIDNFEKALGRRSLWRPAPSPPGKNENDDSIYVPRLRIYPHALRTANAYYSPDKVALLFGYFTSQAGSEEADAPTEQVFTCLSQDVVAHETTHALLDGMHRKYLSNSNPDVLAFHEAFADIVALLQRLTLPDLLRHQIALTRGEVRSRRSLLGELASQFGRAVGERGGLREAIGKTDPKTGQWHAAPEPTGREYMEFTEPHARGSVLVAAVFDALISIYEQRTEDLYRIATEGSGVLRPGAIHPDLVARLAEEATKAASHVLRMCIRALDYCPPTDITYGEYLRAVVTADYEFVPDDDRGYRVAFVEAFRKRGIKPSEVRTLSVESLLWRRQEDEPKTLSTDLTTGLRGLREAANAQAFSSDRHKIFTGQLKVRRALHNSLAQHFQHHAAGPADAAILGLHHKIGFEVHSTRFAMRAGPDGRMCSQVIIGLLQRDYGRMINGRPFEGGSTVIADLDRKMIQYIIRKNVLSQTRYEQQRKHLAAASDKGSVYFAASDKEPFAALHLAAEGI